MKTKLGKVTQIKISQTFLQTESTFLRKYLVHPDSNERTDAKADLHESLPCLLQDKISKKKSHSNILTLQRPPGRERCEF